MNVILRYPQFVGDIQVIDDTGYIWNGHEWARWDRELSAIGWWAVYRRSYIATGDEYYLREMLKYVRPDVEGYFEEFDAPGD